MGVILQNKISNKYIKWNVLMNIIRTASTVLFALVTYPYISRVLLPDATGKVQFAISVVYYFSIFAQLGVPIYGIRAVAKAKDNKEALSKVVQEIFIINLVTCIFTYLVFFICVFSIPRFSFDKILFLIVGIKIGLDSLGIEWLFQGLEEYTYIAVKSVICFVISIIILLLFVHKPEDYRIYALVYVIALSGSKIFNLVLMHKYIFPMPISDCDFAKHIKPILLFFSMSIAVTVYSNLDKVMLGFMTSDSEVGFYGMAVSIKTVIVEFLTAIGVVLLPRMSILITNNKMNDFRKEIQKVLNLVCLVAMPICVYLLVFSEEVIVFAFGKAFYGSVAPLRFLSPTILFIAITNVFGTQMLVPLGREKVVLHSEICGALIDFILNLILIPKFGAWSAAFSTLIAEIMVFVWQSIALRMELSKIIVWKNCIKIIIANLLTFFLLVAIKGLLNASTLYLFIQITISGLIMMIIYVLLLVVLKEDFSTVTLNEIISMQKRKL